MNAIQNICTGCKYYTVGNTIANWCPYPTCVYNPDRTSFYKPLNQDVLQNLFTGAPVIANGEPSIIKRVDDTGANIIYYTYDIKYFTGPKKGEIQYNATSIKLPTIKQSPKNIWLAYDSTGICPVDAENLNLAIWYKCMQGPSEIIAKGKLIVWDDVERFMLV